MERYGLPPGVGFRTGKKGLIKDRPTLVLVHGAGGSSGNFLPQLQRLDRFMNVLALDLPGHGASAGPGRDSISAYVDWLHEALSGPWFESYFLGGHSMGGAIGQEMGLKHPEKILGVILMATGATLRVSPKILEGLLHRPEETMLLINRWCYPPGTDPRVIAQSVELMKQTPASIIHGDFLACNDFQRLEEVKRINVPVLIIVGERDAMTPPDYSRHLQGEIPLARMVVVPGAGHMIMLERPKEVNRSIQEFVKACSQGAL